MALVDFHTYRIYEIESRLCTMGIQPLDVMIVGSTGAGKSTTLNSLFHKTVAAIGDGVDPETMDLKGYTLNNFFRIWDTPGLGDGVVIDLVHKRKMIDLLYKTYSVNGVLYGIIDMVIVIIEGSNRDMGTTYTLLNEVIIPNIQQDRIFVIVNQADLAMKGHHWNYLTNSPDAVLIDYLEEQAISIQRRVKESTGITILKPVYYSAEYNWNVSSVVDLIVDHIPTQCRILMK